MAAITVDPLARGTMFPPELVEDMVSKVRGKSALAKLSEERPIAFNGTREMVFNMPNELDIVGENQPKSHGGVQVDPVTIIPIKFEYGARISDEFKYASEESRLDTLTKFNEGFAKKAGKALDIAAFHGINPKTGLASTVVGTNHFDSLVTTKVTQTAAVDDNLETAISGLIALDHDVTGIAMSPAFAAAMAGIKANGVAQYPEFKFGSAPESFYGKGIDVNSTVSKALSGATETDAAIVGNFADYFAWGYSKEIPVEVIEYGDPDNTGSDLKGHNQIYLRAEIYMGWGILDPTAFSRVVVQ